MFRQGIGLRCAIQCAMVMSLTFGFANANAQSRQAAAVSLMSFNVENLFDTQHDVNREDYTFLPRALKDSPEVRNFCAREKNKHRKSECFNLDWNERVLHSKLQNTAGVILQVENPGRQQRGADILFLSEIENQRVLDRLTFDYLRPAGYQTRVLIEGPDTRGIDVALLSRLPLAGPPQLHSIPFRPQSKQDEATARRTRGILEVPLRLPDGRVLIAFVVHMPAPYHPSYLRAQALEYLATLQRQLPQGTLAVAGGDFNITSEEERQTGFWQRLVSQDWAISHLIGCRSCRGTTYFPPTRTWSFFDALLFNRGFAANRQQSSGWQVNVDSIRLANQAPQQTNRNGTPLRFDPQSGQGTSDHWPVAAEIFLAQ